MFSRMFRKAEPADDTTVADPMPAPRAPAPRQTTPDQALVDALAESRRRFKDIVEVSGDFAWETDAEGAFVFVSLGVNLGYRPDELVGSPAANLLAERATRGAETPFMTHQPVRDIDIWLRTRDGKEACLSTSAIPIDTADGDWSGARGVCRDVTEERRQNAVFAALQRREASMARIVKAASRELDPDAMLRSALAETRNTLEADYVDIRRPSEDANFTVLAAAGDGEDADAPVLRTIFSRMDESMSLVTAADGDQYYLCAPAIFRDEVIGALLIARRLEDGTFTDDERRFGDELATQFAILLAQVDGHKQLESMARTDEMTGLLNRRAFLGELADRTARAGDGGAGGALFYVDLDNFKAVNDVHGHQRGDEALIALADLLVTKTRPGDLVSRLGGDEFAMWLDRTDKEIAANRAEELLDASAGLRVFSGAPDKPLGISVGVAVFAGGSGEQVDELTARADSAMYAIKHGGKSGFVIADAYEETPPPESPVVEEDRQVSA